MSAGKKTLASGLTASKITLWDVRDERRSKHTLKLPSTSSFVHDVAFHPSLEHSLISGSYDGHVRIWDTRAPVAPVWTLEHGKGKVLGLCWGAKDVVVSAGTDKTMRMFDAGTGASVQEDAEK